MVKFPLHAGQTGRQREVKKKKKTPNHAKTRFCVLVALSTHLKMRKCLAAVREREVRRDALAAGAAEHPPVPGSSLGTKLLWVVPSLALGAWKGPIPRFNKQKTLVFTPPTKKACFLNAAFLNGARAQGKARSCPDRGLWHCLHPPPP